VNEYAGIPAGVGCVIYVGWWHCDLIRQVTLRSDEILTYNKSAATSFRCLSDTDGDVDIGMQFARRLVGTQTMKDWGMELTNRLLPECAKLGNYTQSYMECHMRHITLSGMAPVGTCRIGAAADPAAVVDPLLRYDVISYTVGPTLHHHHHHHHRGGLAWTK